MKFKWLIKKFFFKLSKFSFLELCTFFTCCQAISHCHKQNGWLNKQIEIVFQISHYVFHTLEQSREQGYINKTEKDGTKSFIFLLFLFFFPFTPMLYTLIWVFTFCWPCKKRRATSYVHSYILYIQYTYIYVRKINIFRREERGKWRNFRFRANKSFLPCIYAREEIVYCIRVRFYPENSDLAMCSRENRV